jgi:hypothetical protein
MTAIGLVRAMMPDSLFIAAYWPLTAVNPSQSRSAARISDRFVGQSGTAAGPYADL